MILETRRLVVELEYRKVLPLEDAAGATLHCASGRIWVTEQADFQDVVLEAGQAHVIVGSGTVVIQALRGARVALCAPSRLGAKGLQNGFKLKSADYARRPAWRLPTGGADAAAAPVYPRGR